MRDSDLPSGPGAGAGFGFDFSRIQILPQPPSATQGPPDAEEVLRSPGQPLAPPLRAPLEAALETDLGQVMVHTDETAARSAEGIGASAYTMNGHMVFGAGRFRPESAAGRRLIAHEAFHAAHQHSAGSVLPGIAPPDARSEQAADRFADSLAYRGGALRGWMAPAMEGAGPAWQVHPERIVTPGTEVHHGDVGAVPVGPSIGSVSVRTGEEVELASGARIPNVIALEYSGALTADSRWLQFVWFEMAATTPAGVKRSSGSVPTSSGTKPFTTTPASPTWSVDSASTTNPFYEAGFANLRAGGATTIFDAPGGSSAASLARDAFASNPTATAATFTAHFETYLIQRGSAAYRVSWSASTAFTPSKGGLPTAGAIGYTVGASGPVKEVPKNLLDILFASHPGPWAIQ